MSADPMIFNLDTLPDDLKTEASLKDFKTWPDVAKSFVNASKKLGVPPDRLLKLEPDGSAGPDVWKRLGRPDKYEIPADLKTQLPDAYKGKLLEFAAKHNFTKVQFEELMHFTDGENVTMAAAAQAAATQQKTERETALKESFGKSYEQTLNFAKNVPEMFGKGALWAKFEAAGLTLDPDFVGLMGEIGRLAGEDTLVSGGAEGFSISPNQAKATVNSLMADPDFMKAYLTKDHPGHKAAVDRFNSYTQTAFTG